MDCAGFFVVLLVLLVFVLFLVIVEESYSRAPMNPPQGKLLCQCIFTLHSPLHFFSRSWKQIITQQPLSKTKYSPVVGTAGEGVSTSLGHGPPRRAPRWGTTHRAPLGDLSNSSSTFLWATLRAQPTMGISEQEFPGASKLSILVTTHTAYSLK